MLCCVLTPSIIEEKLSLNVTQRETDCLTEEGRSIMDTPEAKGRSMVQREAIILCLNVEKVSTQLFHGTRRHTSEYLQWHQRSKGKPAQLKETSRVLVDKLLVGVVYLKRVESTAERRLGGATMISLLKLGGKVIQIHPLPLSCSPLMLETTCCRSLGTAWEWASLPDYRSLPVYCSVSLQVV